MLAVIVSLGRELAPEISRYESDIEQLISDKSGYSARLSGLNLTWRGLTPELRYETLDITNPNSNIDIVHTGAGYLQLDIVASLWRGSIVIDEVQLHGVDVALNQNDAGAWSIDRNSMGTGNNSPPLPFISTILLNAGRLELTNAQLTLNYNSGGVVPVIVDQASLSSTGSQHHIEGAVKVGDYARTATILANFTGDPWAHQFKGRAFLDIEEQSLPTEFVRSSVYTEGISAKWWLDWQSKTNYKLTGQVTADSLEFAGQGEHKLNNVDLALVAEMDSDNRYQVYFPTFNFEHNKEHIKLLNMRAYTESTSIGRQLKISTTQLKLDQTASLVRAFGGRVLNQLMETLSPSGNLRDIEVSVPLQASHDLITIKADLDGVNLDAWKGAPALEGLTGTLYATPNMGYVDIDSEDLSVLFPALYDEAIPSSNITGRVEWALDYGYNQLLVGSRNLRIANDLGVVRGAFYVDNLITKDRPGTEPNFSLQVALEHGQSEYWRYVVPKTIPSSVYSWLDENIKAGDVPFAHYIYRSSLNKQHRDWRTNALDLTISNGTLGYLKDWPDLKEVSADIQLRDRSTRAQVKRLKAGPYKIDNASLTLTPEKQQQRLRVDADFNADLAFLNDYLKTTPLWSSLGPAFSRWDVKGNANTAFSISSLLGPKPSVSTRLNIDINDGNIHDRQLNLTADNLSGRVNIDNGVLSSKDLTADIFDEEFILKLSSDENGVSASFNGALDDKVISEWSGFPADKIINGRSTALIKVNALSQKVYPQGPNIIVDVSSDLSGMAVDLPDGIGKSSAISVPFFMQVPFWSDGFSLRLELEDRLKFGLSSSQGTLQGLDLTIGDVDREVSTRAGKFEIEGKFGSIRRDNWVAWYKKTAPLVKKSERVDISPTEVKTPWVVKLSADQVIIDDESSLTDVNLYGNWAHNDRSVQLSSKELEGSIDFSDQQRPKVQVDRLDWPKFSDQAVDVANDEVQSDADRNNLPMVLSQLPPLAFKTNHLTVGGHSLGRWDFLFNPVTDGFRLSDIEGEWNSIVLTKTKTSSANNWMEWRYNKANNTASTEVSLDLKSNNVGQVFESLGYQPSPLGAEKTVLKLKGQWEETPTNLSLSNFNGSVQLALEDGRVAATNAGTDALKLLGIFNFSAWAERIKLDFNDDKKGLNFSTIKGELDMNRGWVRTTKPVVMKGPDGSFAFNGDVDLNHSVLDAELRVTIPVKSNVAWITALAAGLPAAAGVFVVSQVFADQFDRLSTLGYKLTGPISKPTVTFKRFFEEGANKD